MSTGDESMDKKFKVTLKFERNQQRYRVVQILGPDVLIRLPRSMNKAVRAGDMITEAHATILGEVAVLTTK
jgi:urease accessory protein UreE